MPLHAVTLKESDGRPDGTAGEEGTNGFGVGSASSSDGELVLPQYSESSSTTREEFL